MFLYSQRFSCLRKFYSDLLWYYNCDVIPVTLLSQYYSTIFDVNEGHPTILSDNFLNNCYIFSKWLPRVCNSSFKICKNNIEIRHVCKYTEYSKVRFFTMMNLDCKYLLSYLEIRKFPVLSVSQFLSFNNSINF